MLKPSSVDIAHVHYACKQGAEARQPKCKVVQAVVKAWRKKSYKSLLQKNRKQVFFVFLNLASLHCGFTHYFKAVVLLLYYAGG